MHLKMMLIAIMFASVTLLNVSVIVFCTKSEAVERAFEANERDPDVVMALKDSQSEAEENNDNADSSKHSEDLELKAFRSAFESKRIEQKEIVLKIKDMSNLKKQEQFLRTTLTAVLNSFKDSKRVLTSEKYQIGEWPTIDVTSAPDPNLKTSVEKLRLAVSSAIENYALFCDLVLYFPDFVQSRLRPSRDHVNSGRDNSHLAEDTPWVIVTWAATVLNVDVFLFTEKDRERSSLALQQLNLIPRSHSFVNPNTKEYKVEMLKQKVEDDMEGKRKHFVSEKTKKAKDKWEQRKRRPQTDSNVKMYSRSREEL